jgi:basic membrane protein A and related proteins
VVLEREKRSPRPEPRAGLYYTNMPDDVKKMAVHTEAGLTGGKVNVFKCPVTDQEGKTIECKGGDHLADGQILSMNFYVKGIDDKIPRK